MNNMILFDESISYKCNINYKSKYVYIDNKPIFIDEYIENYKDKKVLLKCLKNHELILDDIRPYFRHKYTNDLCDKNPISEWHSEWESNFPITEKDFIKINNNQISNRRADAVIEEYNIVIEFQHSYIEKKEVDNRINDYKQHNYNIIWIIDGNDTINVKYLEYSNRYFLEFIEDKWKYNNFTSCDIIFIDIDKKIYRIYPNEVKSNMIDVNDPINKLDFIEYLKTNNEYLYEKKISEQCNLYIKQQGAGNGKTYGLIQMLESKEFEHYKYFIIVTKQHSAKHIIYSEFKDQIDKKRLKYLYNIKENNVNKKYIISYIDKRTNLEYQLVIGTIDSLMFSLGDKNHKQLNIFEGLVNSIIDDYINNINIINYGNVNFTLNKEVCLIIDETQDLNIDYAKAIIRIMRSKYIDTYIVGDKLQSIIFENNAFTYLLENDFPYTKKILYEYINICRRFYHSNLVDFVNNIIKFDKYNLPIIKSYKEDNDYDFPLKIFFGSNIYSNEEDNIIINDEIKPIMEYYDYEVKNNNFKPNDFLFITPFTKKNPLVESIELAINSYWREIYNSDIYKKYAIFHKSETGSSIDLNESEDTTRIVSIHTSKGDGRNVVFCIGLSEQALKKFSGENNNLIYESLIHVALTRQQRKLYIRITNNGDNICQRIAKYNISKDIYTLEPKLSISKNIKYKILIDNVKSNSDFIILRDKIINELEDKTIKRLRKKKQIIDLGHHNIRYACMLIYLYIKIISNDKINKEENIKEQIRAIFIKLKKTNIIETTDYKKYNDKLKEKNLVILKLSDNGRDYKKYYDILLEIMKDIQSKINNNSNIILCPLECIVLYYMIQTTKNGIYSDITINELYNIIDIYSKSFNNELEGHKSCKCCTYFSQNKETESNEKIEKMQTYLLEHYEQINKITNIYDKFLNKYSNVNWLIDHYINFNVNNDNYKINNKFKFIGYNDNYIYIIYIKPQIEINENEILIDSIFDTYLINNIKKPSDNDNFTYNKILADYNKFNNKKIKTIIFSFDYNDYKIIEWKDNNNDDLIIKYKDIIFAKIKEKVISKYIIDSKTLYNYYKFYRNKYINLGPENMINEMIKNLEYNYKNIPIFILDFLKINILSKLENENNIEEQLKILDDYNDNNKFMKELEIRIKKSIENLF